ncbi:MAG TPA: hypothetical protein VGI63_07515 [Verrucomicrobiae bacterium]|jgi:hypothetical protein
MKPVWRGKNVLSSGVEQISPQERAEKLSLEQFVALTENFFNHG